VWSVERFSELADAARRSLAGEGIENAHVVVGDGSEGLAEKAPFEAVVVTAARESPKAASTASMRHSQQRALEPQAARTTRADAEHA
jgi:protein-L-isoaspartate(D-aspartate) O-methyltransferase